MITKTRASGEYLSLIYIFNLIIAIRLLHSTNSREIVEFLQFLCILKYDGNNFVTNVGHRCVFRREKFTAS